MSSGPRARPPVAERATQKRSERVRALALAAMPLIVLVATVAPKVRLYP